MEKKRQNLVRRDCPTCGHVFCIDDMVPPLLTFPQMFNYSDPTFYMGNVNRFTKIKCRCGTKYFLYWKKDGNGFKIKDIEPYGMETVEEVLEEIKELKEEEKAVDKVVKAVEATVLLDLETFKKMGYQSKLAYLRNKCKMKISAAMKSEDADNEYERILFDKI